MPAGDERIMKKHRNLRLHLPAGEKSAANSSGGIPPPPRRYYVVSCLRHPPEATRTRAIKKDLRRRSPGKRAGKDGRDSFGKSRRKNPERRIAGRGDEGGRGRGRGGEVPRDMLSRNRPAGVTSSESILRAFNIARATTEKCRQADRVV